VGAAGDSDGSGGGLSTEAGEGYGRRDDAAAVASSWLADLATPDEPFFAAAAGVPPPSAAPRPAPAPLTLPPTVHASMQQRQQQPGGGDEVHRGAAAARQESAAAQGARRSMSLQEQLRERVRAMRRDGAAGR
jgi:hypothetical protein